MRMVRCDCCKGLKQVAKLGMMGYDKCEKCKGVGQVKFEEPKKSESILEGHFTVDSQIPYIEEIETPAQDVPAKHKEVTKHDDKKKGRR